MARKALRVKQEKLGKIREKYLKILKENPNLSWEERYKLYKKYKWITRYYNRCPICWRVRWFVREFGICRVCLRKYGREGVIMWVRKASW